MDRISYRPSRSSAPPRPGATLATLALELGGERAGVAVRGDPETRILDVHQDSRRVTPGALFVSRTGHGDRRAAKEKQARYLAQALAHGATAILRAAREPVDPAAAALPAIEVPESMLRAAIGIVASAVHHHPSFSTEVLAITGTNGKTTTVSLLADALDRLAGRPACACVGTISVRLGDETLPARYTTPEGDDLARILAWARGRGASHAALEASSHALAQDRMSGTRVRAAGFTNLTQDHLDFHGTMEAYYAAKRRLFTDLHPGTSVVAIDDPYGARLAKEASGEVLRVSSRPSSQRADAEIHVVRSKIDARGIDAVVSTPSGEVAIRSPLLGAHNLENLLVAFGILIAIEVEPARAAAALGASRGARGRLELVSEPGDPVVLVDYAHSPDALARVLSTLRPLARGRLFCVFGCGGDRDPSKRAPMGAAVAAGADLAFVTSDNPRTEDPAAIIGQILEGIPAASAHRVEPDRARAIDDAIAAAGPDDVVLIAGKGHEDYQIVGTEKRPFDDAAEARRALARRRGA
jgi:UDP-N-acetylmuramoyl-L-alanyl-D-glutamate--2,6-diaminopimelate ligase